METRHYRSSIDPASSQRAGRSNDLQQCDRFPTVQVQFSLWFFLCLVEELYYDPGLSCNTVMNLPDDILDVFQCLLIGFSLSLSPPSTPPRPASFIVFRVVHPAETWTVFTLSICRLSVVNHPLSQSLEPFIRLKVGTMSLWPVNIAYHFKTFLSTSIPNVR